MPAITAATAAGALLASRIKRDDSSSTETSTVSDTDGSTTHYAYYALAALGALVVAFLAHLYLVRRRRHKYTCAACGGLCGRDDYHDDGGRTVYRHHDCAHGPQGAVPSCAKGWCGMFETGSYRGRRGGEK
ncbi:hypothetical protein Q5752_006732 [Cryptotrichosporon argae]